MPNLGSEELFRQTNPAATALLAIAHGVQTKVSPEVVGEDVGTRFPHTWDVLMWS